ncbi:hypothetical protein [Pseudotabrizicola sp. 4114]|uniref:hypothetical protein n=1 Tax=Pseudotabrizicola sp. 4114 TaxID=2817731 RepID=UPI0028565C58|nr:hypothetical protein [Pseudorhodobacter sp. 4114]
MFLRLLPPLLVAATPVFVTPAFAEADLCPMTDDGSNCVRILACIGEQGRWFHGRALGRGEGTLAGVMNDGVQCVGDWTSRNAFGTGQASVSCDDGMSATVIYFYQDEYTGTALGKGISNREEVVQSWSGLHVLDYFRDGNPSAEAVMKCGSHDIPVS